MRRLIVTEGLPCSGKSTTAQYIAEKLGWSCVTEGSGNNPADWEFHAFVTEAELCEFSPEEQAVILAGEQRCGGYVVPLAGLEGELFHKLLRRKIYDFLPWETERPVMLDKWRSFAEDLREPVVLDCVLLQNPMCETMMRFGMTEAESAGYIGRIAELIRPLEPMLVYMKTADIRPRIQAALPERGEEWLNAVVDYHCGGAYGKALGLAGVEGYISALEERQRREMRILEGLGLPFVIVEDPFKDWQGAYDKIMTAIVSDRE
ncbi:MAG: hypothetical protein IJ071_10230 [Ruminococcus sp.]|nr:hypothetical protein [Ruminococcus sp.]